MIGNSTKDTRLRVGQPHPFLLKKKVSGLGLEPPTLHYYSFILPLLQCATPPKVNHVKRVVLSDSLQTETPFDFAHLHIAV